MRAILYNRLLTALGFLGLFVAGLLSMEKLMNLQLPCGTAGDCQAISNHPSGYWAGIPVAYFGFVGYGLLTSLAIVRGLTGLTASRPLAVLGVIVAMIGTLASAALQYTSIGVLGKFCPWCFTSAVTMLVTFVVSCLLVNALNKGEVGTDRNAIKLALGGLVLVGALLATSGSVIKRGNSGTAELDAAKEKVKLIPDRANSVGPENAPLTIVEFSDIACPTCQNLTPKLHDYLKQYPGRVRLVYRHFPIPRHEGALPGAVLSEVIARDGRFWEFLLGTMKLGKGEATSVDDMYGVAESIGVNVDALQKSAQNEKDPAYTRVEADINAAGQLGVNATPTFFIVRPGKPTTVAKAGALFEYLEGPEAQAILKGNAKS